MERAIHLPGLTFKQGKRDMSKTYNILLTHLARSHPNQYRGKRTTAYETPDMISTGTRLYTTGSYKEFSGDTQLDDDEAGDGIEWDDLDVDGGGLL